MTESDGFTPHVGLITDYPWSAPYEDLKLR